MLGKFKTRERIVDNVKRPKTMENNSMRFLRFFKIKYKTIQLFECNMGIIIILRVTV